MLRSIVLKSLRTQMICIMLLFAIIFSNALSMVAVAETAPTSTADQTTPITDTQPPSTTQDPAAPTDTAATDAPQAAPAPSSTTDTTDQPPANDTTQQGPTKPPGSATNTYSFNESTGLWENDYYTWDPVTKQTKPKTPVDYSYNPATGQWDTTQWVYNPESGKYQANIVSTPTLLSQEQQQAIDSLPSAQSALLRALLLPASPQGPNANSDITSNATSTGFFDLFHNASISNTIDSQAHSGDAIVASNTYGGNATSGNAQAVATLFNLINSSVGYLGGSNPLLFTANILGNIIGDLLIDPGKFPAPSPSSQQQTDSSLHVQAQNTGSITNDIQLAATSGAATVAENTQAGSATSGDAYAAANVVNAINSAIGSGRSFMGLINIYGNLNGDILLPPGFINSLLASNAQEPQTAVAVTDPYNTNLQNNATNTADITLNDTSTIANNLSVDAQSGNAAVTNNTAAGNAKTGSSDTNVTLFNLTGKQVVGKNALLVFVNVLGSWVGLIMNAPNGTTAGAIGDNSSSIGNKDTTLNNALDVTSNTNNAITNNINVRAVTGDATVSNNTKAGNATSGNALAAVNILNMSSSDFALSDWFGILFINVLGNWYGSFGVDTAAGNPIESLSSLPSSGGTPQVISILPTSSSNAFAGAGNFALANPQATPPAAQTAEDTHHNSGVVVLGSHTTGSGGTNWKGTAAWGLLGAIIILVVFFGDTMLGFVERYRLGRV